MTARSTPYATVILPTLNRDTMLPYALASVQAQTEDSLEILIVLDGATAACRAVAYTAANEDRRIRVLDLLKAPRSGGANSDIAVAQARAERIFYIDDDDLFLPGHVQALGSLLDQEQADIADSRLCSADRGGSLNLGVAPGCSGPIRRLLGGFRLKMIYDTHVAHRKDAHGRIAKWVPDSAERNLPVWEFFSRFANDPACRWVSTPEVTAINLHGAVRRDMSAAARTAEIARWSECINSPPALAQALGNADSAFNLYRLLLADRPGSEPLDAHLADRSCYADVGSRPIERQVFELIRRTLPGDESAVELLVKLSEPVESGYLFESIAGLCAEAFGREQATELLRAASLRSGGNLAGRQAALSFALAWTDPASARDLAEKACALGPDPVGSLADWRDRLARQLVNSA